MTHEQYAALAAEHGATYAIWEAVSERLDAYRVANPDDDRSLYELAMDGVWRSLTLIEDAEKWR